MLEASEEDLILIIYILFVQPFNLSRHERKFFCFEMYWATQWLRFVTINTAFVLIPYCKK